MKTKFISMLTVSLILLMGLTACSKENDEDEELNKIVTIKYEIVPENPADKDVKVSGFYTVLSLDYSEYNFYSLDGTKSGEIKDPGNVDLGKLKDPLGLVSLPWTTEVKVRKGAATYFAVSSPVNVIMRLYMDGKLIKTNDDPLDKSSFFCVFRDY